MSIRRFFRQLFGSTRGDEVAPEHSGHDVARFVRQVLGPQAGDTGAIDVSDAAQINQGVMPCIQAREDRFARVVELVGGGSSCLLGGVSGLLPADVRANLDNCGTRCAARRPCLSCSWRWASSS